MQPKQVGVLGARSLVGDCLLSLLVQAGGRVLAYSRRAPEEAGDGIEWRRLEPSSLNASTSGVDFFPAAQSEGAGGICEHHTAPVSCAAYPSTGVPGRNVVTDWICAAPIWAVPEHFALLEACGARRVVVLSSTSRFTKADSSDPEEQAVAHRLTEAEACVRSWAKSRGAEWVILRPTLIYGHGRDKNIAEIARFIRRFGFFPLFGKAAGLRQPVHAQDVASACLLALQTPSAANRTFNLSGGETLTYRDMVVRVFVALGRAPRLVPVPLLVFRVAVTLARFLPRYRHWSAAMAERMNRDLVFDHSEAAQVFGFDPQPFMLSAEDLAI